MAITTYLTFLLGKLNKTRTHVYKEQVYSTTSKCIFYSVRVLLIPVIFYLKTCATTGENVKFWLKLFFKEGAPQLHKPVVVRFIELSFTFCTYAMAGGLIGIPVLFCLRSRVSTM